MGEGLEGKSASHAVGIDYTAQEGGVKVSQVERRGIRYGGCACATKLSLSTALKTAHSELSLGLSAKHSPLHVLRVLLQVTCSGQVQGSYNTPQLTVVCKHTQRGGEQVVCAAPAGPVTEAMGASFFTLKPRGWPLPKRYSTAYTPGARLAALRSTSASAQETTAFSHIVHHASAWRTYHCCRTRLYTGRSCSKGGGSSESPASCWEVQCTAALKKIDSKGAAPGDWRAMPSSCCRAYSGGAARDISPHGMP